MVLANIICMLKDTMFGHMIFNDIPGVLNLFNEKKNNGLKGTFFWIFLKPKKNHFQAKQLWWVTLLFCSRLGVWNDVGKSFFVSISMNIILQRDLYKMGFWSDICICMFFLELLVNIYWGLIVITSHKSSNVLWS